MSEPHDRSPRLDHHDGEATDEDRREPRAPSVASSSGAREDDHPLRRAQPTRAEEFERVIDAGQGICALVLGLILTVALLRYEHGPEILATASLFLVWWLAAWIHGRRYPWADAAAIAACVLSVAVGVPILIGGALAPTRLTAVVPVVVAVVVAVRLARPLPSASDVSQPDDELMVPDAPRSITLAVGLMLAAAGLEGVRVVFILVDRNSAEDLIRSLYTAFGGELTDGGSDRLLTTGFGLVVGTAAAFAVAWLVLSWAASRGRRWAADASIALSTIYVLSLLPILLLGDDHAPLAFGIIAVVQALLVVTITAALSTTESRRYISVAADMF